MSHPPITKRATRSDYRGALSFFMMNGGQPHQELQPPKQRGRPKKNFLMGAAGPSTLVGSAAGQGVKRPAPPATIMAFNPSEKRRQIPTSGSRSETRARRESCLIATLHIDNAKVALPHRVVFTVTIDAIYFPFFLSVQPRVLQLSPGEVCLASHHDHGG